MAHHDELRNKRIYVGFFAVACLIGAAVLVGYPGHEGFQGALVRVGILLTALCLALPSKNRPAAWKGLSSNWAIFGAIIAAIIIPRAKAMFPIIAVILGIALFARPRKRGVIPPPPRQPESENTRPQ